MSRLESMTHWESNPCTPLRSPEQRKAEIPRELDFLIPVDENLVLELGCGTGVDSSLIAMQNKTTISLDFSVNSIKIARRKVNGSVYSFICADIENLPIRRDAVDVVYSNGVLHHLNSPEKGVEECSRVLKSNGKLRIMLYSKRSLFFHWLRRPWRSKKAIAKSYDKNAPITKFYSKSEVRNLLRSFRVESILVSDGVYGKMKALARWFGWYYIRAVKSSVASD